MGKREVAGRWRRGCCARTRVGWPRLRRVPQLPPGSGAVVGLATMQAHPDLQRLCLEPNEKGDKLRSEITVDQVRGLGQWFSLTSQFGVAQVALVDPADALNTAAANALLKTLEEPAAGRYLMLVASRPGRLPATIRSPPAHRAAFIRPLPRVWLASSASAAPRGGPRSAARVNPGLAGAGCARGLEMLERWRAMEPSARALGAGSARRPGSSSEARQARFAFDRCLAGSRR